MTHDTDPLLTDRQLAEVLGLSRAMIHRLRSGGMPSHTFGRARRYRAGECIAWADAQSEAA